MYLELDILPKEEINMLNQDTSILFKRLIDQEMSTEAVSLLFFDSKNRGLITDQANAAFKFGDFAVSFFCVKFSNDNDFEPSIIIDNMLSSITIYETDRESSLKLESENQMLNETLEEMMQEFEEQPEKE